MTLELWRDRWRTLTRRAARAQSHVVLFAFYYLLFVPAAWLIRAATDGLWRTRRGPVAWMARRPVPRSLEAARRQY